MEAKKLLPGAKTTFTKVLNLLFSYPTDTWEFANSILLGTWGGWVFYPGIDIFKLPSYWIFLEFMPEWGWGLFAFMLSWATFTCLFISKYSIYRGIPSFISSAFWFTIAYGIVKSEYLTASTPIYLVFSLLCLLAGCRLLWVHRHG